MTTGISRFVSIVLLLALNASVPAHASQVRGIDLEQMTRRAARIFSGRCIETEVIFDPALGRDVTVATFQVHRAVKGVAGNTVTVRMDGAGGDAPAGLPAFQAGEDVILFLYGESAQGFSSPVGLGQGRFKVITDKQGRRLALNDFGNRNLLTGLRPEARARLRSRADASPRRAAAQPRDDLDPTALLDVVQTLLDAEP